MSIPMPVAAFMLLLVGFAPLAAGQSADSPAIAMAAAGQANTVTVDVVNPKHAIPPTLFGIFFEDINLSADGGIYPERVRNRSFEDDVVKAAGAPADEKAPPVVAPSWSLENETAAGSTIAIDDGQPLNPLNRRSLRWDVVRGPARLVNEGYYGMAVAKGATYRLSIAARAAGNQPVSLDVALRSPDGQTLAEGTIAGIGKPWGTQATELVASASHPQAVLVITAPKAGTVWLDMVSLLPKETWKGHGLRIDLCQMLAGLQPAFLRFPGGCWVEGDDMAHMYHWKRTIGDVAHRTPLWNIWQYNATHGLGYHEYLQLSEDLGAEPLFCINAGMSHKENVPLDQMGQWVQDALDAIEYANGPVESVWGSRRAAAGHPAPFRMKYLEIGNENGGPAYYERWALFYKAIKARCPQMQLIANVWGGQPTDPRPDILDEHYYNTPEFFLRQASKYDAYDRSGPKIFVGEYAVTRDAGLGNLRAAVGEAAFMTGLERNSDHVVMACYAPLFCNANHKRWPINLINFDSARAFGLPGYYVQQMFAANRGDVALPVKAVSAGALPPGRAGAVGVGTWRTKAEFKDVRVTSADGRTLLASDFANRRGWRNIGGKWETADGVLRQTTLDENVRAVAGERTWRDYTLELKARKLAGQEGFLILFQTSHDREKCWWNLGGWGNRRHGLEVPGIDCPPVEGSIETGRWYDIRIESTAARIRCFLDGKLIHDAAVAPLPSLYASAALAKATGEVIVKVVNAHADEQEAEVRLNGVDRVAGGEAIVLTSASPLDENTLDEPTKVAPVRQAISPAGGSFSHRFPGNSVSVLRLKRG